MLIIGHRGSAGTHPEHSLLGLHEAASSGAHFVEFDVRTTRDNQIILAHDSRLSVTDGKTELIKRMTLNELKKASPKKEIITLSEALHICKGNAIAIVEVKDFHSIEPVAKELGVFIKADHASWDDMMVASFNPLALARLRHHYSALPLSMLHSLNPFGYFAWQRTLGLSSVGFHRLHLNDFATEVARQSGLMSYAFTVNRTSAAAKLAQDGLDGVVTDFPRKFADKLA